MEANGTVSQTSEDISRWTSKAFLDILREHITPNLPLFYATSEAPSSESVDTLGQVGLTWRSVHEQRLETRAAREAHASIGLVCADWSAAQRQSEQEVVQVRLWDASQVKSLESHLRHRPRVAALRLHTPLPDATDAPGMVAAVSDLLYGDGAADTNHAQTAVAVRASGASDSDSKGRRGAGTEEKVGGSSVGFGGDRYGVDGSQGVAHPTGEVSSATRIGSALPRSLRCLEADGPTAVPLLLLAAAELPLLESLSLSQLPAAWTYEEGALPWPSHARARLKELVPPEAMEQAVDSKLYVLMYGAAVQRRFKSYWSSYDGALAAMLLHRGHQLRELSLEAPARSVGLKVVEMLARQGPCRLESLRLRGFGFRREPHQAPRWPLERVGLKLDAALRSLAGERLSGSHTGCIEHHHHQQFQQPQQQEKWEQELPPRPQQEWRSQAGASNAAEHLGAPVIGAAGSCNSSKGRDRGPDGGGQGRPDGNGAGGHEAQRMEGGLQGALGPLSGNGNSSDIGMGAGGGGDKDGGRCFFGPHPHPDLSMGMGMGSVGHCSGCCSLTRLELVSCGVEPLEAGTLEGLTGLRTLSLRGSSFTWRDRPPDLRPLRHLRSLDLRRCDWLTSRGAPWDEPLLLPASLEELDLIGFSSLTAVDLGSLERLTALAELSDITLQPDPADRSPQQPLQPPYTGLAALTCMDTIRMYIGRARLAGCRGHGGGMWLSDDDDDDDDEDGDDAASLSYSADSHGCGGGGGKGSDGSVRHGIAACERRRQRGSRRGGHLRGRAGEIEDGDESTSKDIGQSLGVSGGDRSCGDKGSHTRSYSHSSSSGGGGGGGGGAVGVKFGSVGSDPRLGVRMAAPLGAVPVARTAPSLPRPPPLVSLTLYGVLPQYVSDLFPALSLLTRLVFGGGKEENHRDESDGDDDNEGVGQLVLRAGELPRLRELELREGLLGYVRLALGPAVALTRLVVDDVEYVDVRYIELPPSLQYLSLTAWFGLPDLYRLSEGPLLSSAVARAAACRLRRDAIAREAGHGNDRGDDCRGGGRSGGSSGSSGDEGSDDGSTGDGGGSDWKSLAIGISEGGDATAASGLLGISTEDGAPCELTRALEAEVERHFVQRILPPLKQLRVLQLNWDVVTHGPLVTGGGGQWAATAAAVAGDASAAAARMAGGGRGSGSGGGGGSGTAVRWPFPHLPLLEELNIPWMQDLPEEDLARVLISCPALRAITHGNGHVRSVRGTDGSWSLRSVRTYKETAAKA